MSRTGKAGRCCARVNNHNERVWVNTDAIITAYRRYARIYDILFGPIFHPGRKSIVEALGTKPGDRILEVGVGTGLSLPLYSDDIKVTGIDISAHMLAKARQRVARDGLDHVEDVLEMDAQAMQFPDASFDKVVAMYVVSVVPDPVAVVNEMRRVCKPGGDIYIVNHFRSHNPVLGGVEGMLAPISKLAGFRPDFELEGFLDATGLEVLDTRSVNLFGYWKMLRCRNTVRETAAAVSEEKETASAVDL